MAKYAPRQNPNGDVAAGYIPTLDFIRAVDAAPVKSAATGTEVTADLKAAKNVPLALTLGATATCNGEVFKVFKSICSDQAVLETFKSKTKFSFSLVNTASLINAAFP